LFFAVRFGHAPAIFITLQIIGGTP
jgi:hypothetical protein